MKKSIFLFFAAILCAMTANAQWALMGTLTDWSSGKAMTVSGTTATCTVDLPGKTTYTLKVKNSGTWYGKNSTTISATTTTGAFSTSGGDVTLNTEIPGTYTFSFNTSSKTLTVTYPTAPAPHDITVRAQVPASWTNDIYAHVWTSENATGSDVGPLTKDGDYYVVTKNAGALYVIFKNGAGWNGDKTQTVDLCYTEDVCLQLNQSGSAKATATVIDCGAVSKDITVKAVVPGAWENTITAWVWPTGGEGEEVTPTKEGNWYVITKNCIELNVIFKNGTGWNGDENQTVNIEGVSENTCYQISALNKEGGKCSVTIVDCEAAIEPEEKPAPTPTYDYYVVGSFNGWNEKDPTHGMTLDGEVYKATITLADGENLVKVTNGTWTDAKGFSAMGAEYEEVSAGAIDDNIAVTLAAGKDVVVVYNATTKKVTFEGLTEKAPAPTFDYYITGSFNGNNPKKAENGMTLDGTVYKTTVTLAEGDNTLKVTDGTWDKTWGANELGAAYEEVSNPNDYNNIKITLAAEAEKNITVIFDATAGKITFEGLTPYVAPLTYTVTVPAGTEKCYIAGPKNVWDFQEMEAVTGEANKFTITIVGAKETDQYKYACKADWAYAEVIEGGGNRTNWSELDEVTAWNKPVVYTYYLMGVNDDWGTGIEMEVNTDAENEVMLTCQPVNGQVKIKRVGDDASEYWFGGKSLKEDPANLGTNTEAATDGDGNIELAAGKYNFYFNTADGKLWIAAATGCPVLVTVEDVFGTNTYTGVEENGGLWSKEYNVGDEVTLNIASLDPELVFAYWSVGAEKIFTEEYTFTATEDVTVTAVYALPMEVTFDNMTLDTESWIVEAGPDDVYGVTLFLGIDMDNDHPKGFGLVDGSQIYLGEDELELVTGYFTAVDQNAPSAEAVIIAVYMDELMAFVCSMSGVPTAAVPVEVLDGTASVNGAGELWITGQWEGDDVYVQVPGFNGASFTCPEIWFYVGGTDFETASIIAFGPATITVDGNDVLVEGTITSGATNTDYELFVIGTLPAAPQTYTRTVTNGEWGTICLPYASSSVTGATFYEVSSLVVDEGLWLDQLADGAQLEAGKPYIFQATATEIAVTYTGEAFDAPVAGANGLTGTFTEIAAGGALVGNYIIAENQVWSAGTGASLAANRAYINAAQVPGKAQAQIPGRRRVIMGAEDEGTSTGFENITTTDKAVKIIENGQLIIIRNGEKFNAQGVKF